MTQEAQNQDGIDIRLVDVNSLDTNTWNPNAMEQEMLDILAETVKEEGMVQPVLVRPHPDLEGRFMVVDGEHRFRASKMAGLKQIAVVVVPYDDTTAKIRTISMNQIKGNYVPLKMAKLLAELQDIHTPAEIRRMTGIKEDEIKSLSKLLEVPDIDFNAGGPSLSSNDVSRPIQVNIMLMPDEHGTFEEAMIKAMELAGPKVIPLVAEEVMEYDKAMKGAFGLAGTKLRNVGMATICAVFNAMPQEQKEEIIGQIVLEKEAS